MFRIHSLKDFLVSPFLSFCVKLFLLIHWDNEFWWHWSYTSYTLILHWDPTLRDMLASWHSISLNKTYRSKFMKYCYTTLIRKKGSVEVHCFNYFRITLGIGTSVCLEMWECGQYLLPVSRLTDLDWSVPFLYMKKPAGTGECGRASVSTVCPQCLFFSQFHCIYQFKVL